MSKHHVTTTINGEPMEFLCEAQQTLLDVLRDELHLTGSKEGCGSGDCGACSVILDGKLVCSCLMLGVEAEGRTVTTVEGIAQGDKLHPVQQKFLEHAALQCGFCTPGFIVAAKALLDENKNPTEEETRYWLAGNLCRCTGYDKIIRAVLDAAAGDARGGEPMSYLDKASLKVVGTRPIRPDGVDKVTGRANFGADMVMPGMLWGRIKRSPHAHARIVAIKADKALALPGVKAVITGADFPHGDARARPYRRGAGQSARPVAQRHRQGQGALRGPRGGRGRGDLAGNRRTGARPDRGRVRGAAACDGCRGGDGGRRAAPARRHLHRRRRAEADQAVKRLQGGALRQGRRRGRVPRGRHRHRAALHDKAGAPGLYRAACLPRFGRGRRAVHDLQFEPGPVHGARLHLAHRRRRDRRYPRDPGRDRRRVRRQDDRLSRAARLHAVEEIGPAGQDGDEPRGGVPRHRPDLGRGHRSQARRQEGRPYHRRAKHPQISGGRVPGVAGAAGLHLRPRGLRFSERADHRLRRLVQPAQGRRLPRAGRADRFVRRRKLHGRTRRRAQHRALEAARDQRRQGRHQGDARRDLGQYRLPEDPGGRPGDRAFEGAARPQSGARHRLGLLAQRRRRIECRGARQRGRHGHGHRGPSRYRRLARLDGDDGGRGAGRPLRERPAGGRRHDLDRLQRLDRRQPGHLRRRHGGDAGGRESRRGAESSAPR